MAPALRSSTQNTPSKTASKASTSNASSTVGTPTKASTPSGTPRKTHTCTKCKRPKAGHPRSGCPYVDSPSGARVTPGDSEGEEDSASDDAQPAQQGDSATPQRLSQALQSLYIAPGTPTPASPKTPLRRENARRTLVASDTLTSLSTTSSEIVTNLQRPGIMSKTSPVRNGGLAFEEHDDLAAKVTKVVRWQDLVMAANGSGTTEESSVDRKPRSPAGRMPCTLVTPSPSVSLLSIASQGPTTGSAASKSDSDPASSDLSSSISSLPSQVSSASTASTTRPLSRTMSMEQRDAFLDRVNEAARATIYTLPTADVPTIQESATAVGYFSRVIEMPVRLENGKKGKSAASEEDDESWLILGRTERAVQRLYDSVQEDLRARDGQAKPRRTSGIGAAAAGGAVIGAVATFTGLAFS
ncbi:hypothetical protein HGRIS_010092 [Hohenbuehelia grisea]|uniref:Uncharacterized protein n=1 Tax=Hohenbuehelia grisea TaxID=104357 RepID=A0ABR3J3G6_9AGAR